MNVILQADSVCNDVTASDLDSCAAEFCCHASDGDCFRSAQNLDDVISSLYRMRSIFGINTKIALL